MQIKCTLSALKTTYSHVEKKPQPVVNVRINNNSSSSKCMFACQKNRLDWNLHKYMTELIYIN